MTELLVEAAHLSPLEHKTLEELNSYKDNL